MRRLMLGLLMAAVTGAMVEGSGDQDRTSRRLERIKQYIGEAGQLYNDEEFQAAANKISAAQRLLERAIDDDVVEYKDALLREHGRVAKAHELLTTRGFEFSELAPFPEDFGSRQKPPAGAESTGGKSAADTGTAGTGDAGSADRGTVSFTAEIAPILSNRCGNCHMRESRGEYSMASFQALMKGGPGGESVVAGKPDASLLYELIESGDMPPRRELADREKQLIRKWIEEGAAFDGDDPKAAIGGNSRGNRRGNRRGR
jgi:hypothetical protein